MTSRSRRSLPVLVLAVAFGVTGCSEGVDRIDDPVASSTAPSSTAAPTPAPSASATAGDGARGRLTSSEIEVDEVRNGCVYVTTPGGERWALRGGGIEDLVVGERVEVTGAPDDTPYEECPDGVAFLVDRIDSLG